MDKKLSKLTTEQDFFFRNAALGFFGSRILENETSNVEHVFFAVTSGADGTTISFEKANIFDFTTYGDDTVTDFPIPNGATIVFGPIKNIVVTGKIKADLINLPDQA